MAIVPPLVPGDTPTPALRTRARGKHHMAACCACKKKRKKCDGKYPVCSACASANIPCTIRDLTTSRVIPRNYIQTLEERVADLEAVVALSGNRNRLDESSPQSSTTPTSSTSAASKGSLEMEVGYITLGAAAESRYLGASSAYSIAKAITNLIHYYRSDSAATLELHLSQPNDVEEEQPFVVPSKSVAQRYLSSYKRIVQCQYPFLDWEWVAQGFDNVIQGTSATAEELFFTYMILAIGLQVTESALHNVSTKRLFSKALESITPIIEANTLRTVQAYLILAMFSQKMPDGSLIWQTTGLAIRTAVGLGLHREPYRKEEDQGQLKTWIFWSAYGLERINGMVLGRPFGISDVDIDAPLPLETPDTAVACHVVRLRRIQSSICSFVYKPQHHLFRIDSKEADATRVEIVLELNNWVLTFPAKSEPLLSFETPNWSLISYHNLMLLLLRPVVLEVLIHKRELNDRLIEWFKVFTQLASAICLNYKEIHAKGKMSYTWLALHCVFVAGLSFLYCLWVDLSLSVLEWRRRGVVYDTISACSSILYVLAERFSSAAVFRDTFESISNTVLQRIDESKVSSVLRDTTYQHQLLQRAGPSYGQESTKFLVGALSKESIGIDQYLGFDLDEFRDDETSGIQSEVLQQNPLPQPNSSQFDGNLWEYLDNTGDKYLRHIYYHMENGLL